MGIMNDLHAVGLNPFGVQLVAESMLRSPVAPMSVKKPLALFFPVQRSDCAGWAGVKITLEAMRPPCGCQDGTCESKADCRCRMEEELLQQSGYAQQAVLQIAKRLLEAAADSGQVVTIEQRPLQPLAMGHFETVVSVRPARPKA